MAYEIRLKKSAERELENLPAELHDRVVKRLLSLKENARPHGAKKLRGREGYRLRVGDYRILYLVEDAPKTVDVFSVAHRGDVYR